MPEKLLWESLMARSAQKRSKNTRRSCFRALRARGQTHSEEHSSVGAFATPVNGHGISTSSSFHIKSVIHSENQGKQKELTEEIEYVSQMEAILISVITKWKFYSGRHQLAARCRDRKFWGKDGHWFLLERGPLYKVPRY